MFMWKLEFEFFLAVSVKIAVFCDLSCMIWQVNINVSEETAAFVSRVVFISQPLCYFLSVCYKPSFIRSLNCSLSVSSEMAHHKKNMYITIVRSTNFKWKIRSYVEYFISNKYKYFMIVGRVISFATIPLYL